MTLKFETVSQEALEQATQDRKKFQLAKDWYKGHSYQVPGDIIVHWTKGSGLPGHDIIRDEVQRIINEEAQNLLMKAYERIELKARQSFALAMATTVNK